jgi:hypothetical protein
MWRRWLPWVSVVVHRWYTRFLWGSVALLMLALVLVSKRIVIDRDVAEAITGGCAYFEDVLYLRYILPVFRAVLGPRQTARQHAPTFLPPLVQERPPPPAPGRATLFRRGL